MIYVAAPFWHDDQNIRNYRRRKAIEYSEKLFYKGQLFYSPLLYSERFKDKKAKEGFWLQHGLKMVEVCTAMHILCLEGWEDSSGVKGEVARAEKMGMEIIYVHEVSRVSFHGSRTLQMSDVEPIFKNLVTELQIETVVTHGEPTGACAHIRELCKKSGMKLMLHHLDKSKAQGMHHWRSVAVLDDSEFAVFLHDGVSSGTSNELALALKRDMHHRYYVLQDGVLVQKSTEKKKARVEIGSHFEDMDVASVNDLDL